MAGIYSLNPTFLSFRRIHGIRCCSAPVGNEKKSKIPPVLKLAVSGATQLLKLFSSSSTKDRGSYDCREEISVSGIDDVIMILMCDYENAYFVTGIFTSAIYAEDCIFEDPTIRFQGTELYSRNLNLLIPFLDCPSIGLQNIEKGVKCKTNYVLASWKLRTYLRFPWRPLISIDGSTVYELDDEFKIVRHSESWNVSALEAIGQIFTPSFGKPSD